MYVSPTPEECLYFREGLVYVSPTPEEDKEGKSGGKGGLIRFSASGSRNPRSGR